MGCFLILSPLYPSRKTFLAVSCWSFLILLYPDYVLLFRLLVHARASRAKMGCVQKKAKKARMIEYQWILFISIYSLLCGMVEQISVDCVDKGVDKDVVDIYIF